MQVKSSFTFILGKNKKVSSIFQEDFTIGSSREGVLFRNLKLVEERLVIFRFFPLR